jgi:signal transduction histidine kinase/CheY-like chemotaxis protein
MTSSLRQLVGFLQQRLPDHMRESRSIYMLIVLVLAEFSAALALVFQPVGLDTWMGTFFCLSIGLLLLAFYRGLALPLVVYGGSFLGSTYLFAISLREGGIYSSTLAWIPLISLGVFYVIGPRSGRIWMLLAALLQCLMALATWVWGGHLPPMGGPNLAAMSFIDYVLASMALYLVPHFYQRQFDLDLAESQTRQKELQVQQQELEHTAQMREHFIAMVSHELRTPMNAILGLNNLLLDSVKDKPQAMRVLVYTRQSANHLMTVINDVLDYSQLSSGQLRAKTEPLNLHEAVRAAYGLFLPRIENTQLRYACEIDADVPKWVQTDGHRLVQILVNLLGNAVKFTHVGHVRLCVRVQDVGVLFEVQDTGIGIPLEQQQRIFQRFTQADPSIHQHYGGSGLGLTISQQLVQLLGGKLGLESHDGAGSLFWFWLPLQALAEPQTPQAPLQRAQPDMQRTWRFLVVDDHPINRLLARQALLRQWPGSEVQECDDGDKAVRMLEAADGKAFDLVLMDMVMPVMDGVEATQKIRQSQQERVRSTPLLGLTANVSTQDLARFEQAGLNSLLLKPVDLERLREEVARLLRETDAKL